MTTPTLLVNSVSMYHHQSYCNYWKIDLVYFIVHLFICLFDILQYVQRAYKYAFTSDFISFDKCIDKSFPPQGRHTRKQHYFWVSSSQLVKPF